MSSAESTPGPWTPCFSSENRVNFSFHITASPHGSVRPIVRCTWPWDEGRVETETLTANAHLIAAAPDLYEALYDLKKWIPSGVASDQCLADFNKAKAALAKARGEPS